MEFYELNRLYDINLPNFKLSKLIYNYLYIIMPIVISFGCGVTLINIISFTRPYFKSPSKSYLISQSVFNFIFQIVTTMVFFTNNYEKQLMENIYFKNNKKDYFNLKVYLNFFYNIIMYCLIWLFVIGALDFCFISIKKFHLNLNYNRLNRKLFHKYQAQLNYQQKLLNQQQNLLKINNNNKLNVNLISNDSISGNSFGPNCAGEEVQHIESLNQPIHHVNYSTDNDQIDLSYNRQESFYDETSVFELNYDQNGKKIKYKKKKTETGDTQFFSPKLIRISIYTIIILSVSLAVPQLFGYEVKQNIVSVSPSAMPANFENENIYFIEPDPITVKERFKASKQEVVKKSKQVIVKNLKDSLIYSKNIPKALGFSLRISQDKETNEIINRMRKTHTKFFTPSGFYNLASSHYDLCNMVKNLGQTETTTTKINTTKLENENSALLIVNITLICIKKSDLNSLLTYNTLYFWLEHTMVISAPIFIVIVVLGTLIYNCFNFSKLLTQQTKIREKRMKILKHQQQNSLNRSINMNSSFKLKMVQIKDDTDLNKQIEEHNLNENKIIMIQTEDQNLNKLFIIDLVFYLFISFPYTLMRLILDLFTKEQIKINLDFFIIYKFTLILFHVHLISKFFLFIIFNYSYRFTLLKAFSFQSSILLKQIPDSNDQDLKNFNTEHSCCCCFSKFFRYQSELSLNKLNMKNCKNYDFDELKDRSTEFNSKFHQFNCPADPDLEILQDKISPVNT